MLQTLINLIRAYELPITFGVGLLGVVLFEVGDILRSRNLKLQQDESRTEAERCAAKRDKLPLSLMIAGGILAVASCIAFGVGGYYEPFLDLFR